MFQVVANVTEPDYTSGDVVCQDGQPDAEPGGFLNTAILTSGKVTTQEQACEEPAQPEFAKELDQQNPLKYNGNGSWTVTYLLTVKNPSDLQLNYNLTDTLDFAPNTVVTDSDVTVDDLDVELNPLWEGSGVAIDVVKPGQEIKPTTTHTFTVTVTLTVEDDFVLADAECTSPTSPKHGLFNTATMTAGGIPQTEKACDDLPLARLTLTKDVDNTAFDGIEPAPDVAQSSDWTLKADGSLEDLSGISGTDAVTSVLVPAGSYALDEDPVADPSSPLVPDYYTASDWTCDNDDEGSSVELAIGDEVDCTITNTGYPVDLEIDKDDNGAVIDEGDGYTYTFEVTNNGDIAAKDVVVTDEIPDTLKVDTSSFSVPAGWENPVLTNPSPEGYGGVLTVTMSTGASLAPGVPQVITFKVTSAVDLPREGGNPTGKILDIENTAVVTSSGVEVDPSDNTSTEDTPVKSLAIEILGTCTLNAPYATWSITPYNAVSSDTVSIIWWTPAAYAARNPDIDASNVAALLADGALQVDVLPMPGGGWTSGDEQTGTQLWAGATVDPVTHKGTGWPGYALVNGQWKLDPTNKFYPIRNSAIVEVRMNPSTGATVGYPPASINCSAFPPFDLPTLALTGAAGAAGWIVGSGIFLLFGAIFVAVSKRRAGRHTA